MNATVRVGVTKMMACRSGVSVRAGDALPPARCADASSRPSSVEPRDSVSNISGDAASTGLAPPDVAGLAKLLELVPEGQRAAALSAYTDMYGAYCRSAVGFNPRGFFDLDVDSNVDGLAAVDALTERGLCCSSVSSGSGSNASRSSRGRRSMLKGRSFGVKESVRQPASAFPEGLCYARAFRASARESVAYSLGFWPTFEALLSQPAEAALPLCATESLGLASVSGGYHLVDANSPVAQVSFNDALVGLSRRISCPYGSYGSLIASARGFPVCDVVASTLLAAEDRLGGLRVDGIYGSGNDARDVPVDTSLCVSDSDASRVVEVTRYERIVSSAPYAVLVASERSIPAVVAVDPGCVVRTVAEAERLGLRFNRVVLYSSFRSPVHPDQLSRVENLLLPGGIIVYLTELCCDSTASRMIRAGADYFTSDFADLRRDFDQFHPPVD